MKKILAISLLTLLAVSIYAASDNSQQLSVRQTFSQSADISLSQIAACRNIAISGQCQINHNGQTSLFRAILVDENGEEYLVVEFNDLISSEQQVSFNSRCDETAFSSSVKPAKLKIIVVNAQATIDNVTYDNNESATRGSDDIAAAKSTRVANEIALYNQAIQREGMLWIAGETSLSNLTYSQKKKIFGATSDSCCWYGLEHYKGGIYSTPSYLTNRDRNHTPPSQYVPKFTWQRRHGINWNTSVKDQGPYNTCYAFSTAALAETYANIYFNQKIDLDLSEQDIVSCSNSRDTILGLLKYITNTGIVKEDCFQYEDTTIRCDSKPSNCQVEFSSGAYFYHQRNTVYDILKSALIKYGPIITGITVGENIADTQHHAMLLVGYGIIHAGDTLHNLSHATNFNTQPIIIQIGNQYIGDYYWIFKNSWGIDHGVNGYMYAFLPSPEVIEVFGGLASSPNLQGYSLSDKVCEDLDGDGFYNWGIGAKPAHCPACPDQRDGNDRNPNIGGMDDLGFSTYIGNPNGVPQIYGPDVIGCSGKFAIQNINDEMGVEWTIDGASTTFKPLIIDGPNSEALLIVNQGTVNDSPFSGYVTIRATLGNGNTPINLTKTIYVAGELTPYVNLQNVFLPIVGKTRTFTELHCTDLPDQYIRWDVTVPGVGQYTHYGHSVSVRPTLQGVLSVSVTNLAACDSATATFSFSLNVAGGQIILANNPADNFLNYELEISETNSKSSYTVDVVNSNGIRLDINNVKSIDGPKQINTSAFMEGYYTIRLLENGQVVDTKNFVVRH